MDEGARLSTEMVESELRTQAWREFTEPFFDVSPAPGQADLPMHGEIGIRPVGSGLLGPTGVSAQRQLRSRRTVVAGGYEHFVIQLLTRGGGIGDFDGNERRLEAGDICLFDYARPFHVHVDASATLSLVVPRAAVEQLLGRRALHGAVIGGRSPLGQLVVSMMTSVDAVGNELGADEAEGAIDAILTLIARGISHAAAAWPETPGSSRALREVISRHIQENLRDPRLGPAALMARFNVSRAHLYRLFEGDGGVMSLVRERRLDAFYRALTRPENSSETVAAMAREWGFSSVDQLQRNFRARFGVTPTEARENGYNLSVGDRSVSQIDSRITAFAERFRTEGR